MSPVSPTEAIAVLEAATTSEPSMDAGLVERLIDLRALLEEGKRIAGTPGRFQKNVGIVLLDAAVERALYLAVETHSKVGQKNEYHQLLSEAEKAIPQWATEDRATVKELHRVRNAAHHHGIAADAESIPRWVIGADRFVRGLVQAAFNTELGSVAWSGIIADSQLRRKVQDAEAYLAAKSLPSALSAVGEALEEASSAWKRYNSFRMSMDSPLIGRPLVNDGRTLEGVAERVSDLSRTMNLAALSFDPGELAWYLDLQSRFFEVEEHEVDRAIRFVAWWILAFEATPAASRLDREYLEARNRRKVRTEALIAALDSVTLEEIGDEQVTLRFSVSDVPAEEEGFNSWKRLLAATLSESFGHMSQVYTDGSVVLERQSAKSLANVKTTLESALAVAEERVAAEEAEYAEQEEIERRRAASFKNEYELPDGYLPPHWVVEIRYVPESEPYINGEGIGISTTGVPLKDLQEAAAAIRRTGLVADCGHDFSHSMLLSPVIDPEELIMVLRTADGRIRELNHERATKKAVRSQTLASVISALAAQGLVVVDPHVKAI